MLGTQLEQIVNALIKSYRSIAGLHLLAKKISFTIRYGKVKFPVQFWQKLPKLTESSRRTTYKTIKSFVILFVCNDMIYTHECRTILLKEGFFSDRP